MDGGSGELVIPERADVVVAGGGFSGLAVARLLAEGGASVVVLAGSCDGPSALGSGQALCGVVEYPWRIVQALGLAGAQPLYDLFVQGVDLIDGWGLGARRGGWWAALDAREHEEITRSAEVLPRLGLEAEVRTAAETLQRTGLSGAHSALYLPRERSVDPSRALERLRGAARAKGAAVVDLPLVAVRDEPEYVLARTARGDVRAEVVVYAAGAGERQLDPFFEGKVLPVRDLALRVDRAGQAPASSGRAGFGYSWWRATGEDPAQWVAGGCRWATPHLEVGEDVAETVPAVQAKIEAFALRLPADGQIRGRWSWIEAHTCDGLPIVGPLPGSVRHIACVGFCGNDLALGLGAAHAVAAGLVGTGQARVEPRFAATRFDG